MLEVRSRETAAALPLLTRIRNLRFTASANDWPWIERIQLRFPSPRFLLAVPKTITRNASRRMMEIDQFCQGNILSMKQTKKAASSSDINTLNALMILPQISCAPAGFHSPSAACNA